LKRKQKNITRHGQKVPLNFRKNPKSISPFERRLFRQYFSSQTEAFSFYNVVIVDVVVAGVHVLKLYICCSVSPNAVEF
jgi:hypothetical protein